jgi:predicted DNA-binding protein YlxM (UPF0122 family)
MKKIIPLLVILLFVSSNSYSQYSISNKFPINRSVIYHNKLQKSLMFKGFSNKNKFIQRKKKTKKLYKFRIR